MPYIKYVYMSTGLWLETTSTVLYSRECSTSHSENSARTLHSKLRVPPSDVNHAARSVGSNRIRYDLCSRFTNPISLQTLQTCAVFYIIFSTSPLKTLCSVKNRAVLGVYFKAYLMYVIWWFPFNAVAMKMAPSIPRLFSCRLKTHKRTLLHQFTVIFIIITLTLQILRKNSTFLNPPKKITLHTKLKDFRRL